MEMSEKWETVGIVQNQRVPSCEDKEVEVQEYVKAL